MIDKTKNCQLRLHHAQNHVIIDKILKSLHFRYSTINKQVNSNLYNFGILKTTTLA